MRVNGFPLGYCNHILLGVAEITTPQWKKDTLSDHSILCIFTFHLVKKMSIILLDDENSLRFNVSSMGYLGYVIR
jgi:hypothetical protein